MKTERINYSTEKHAEIVRYLEGLGMTYQDIGRTSVVDSRRFYLPQDALVQIDVTRLLSDSSSGKGVIRASKTTDVKLIKDLKTRFEVPVEVHN